MTAEYYVNDAGNQIDLLGVSLQLEGRSALLGEEVEWPEKYYRGDYLSDLAREAVVQFGEESLRDESRQKELALWAKDKILALIVADLKAINVYFDTFVGEASLYGEWDRVMAKMGDGVYQNEGKTFIHSSDFGDDHDRVVVRDDGRPTYLAGDIIYHNQKFERGYEDYINIWGADHHGYIARVKAAVSFLGYNPEKLEVQLSQMVSLLKDGEPFKMSKRAGTVIQMNDVVEEIGADALRFMFASKKCDTALEFDIEELKRTDSSNPIYYVQYAHARIQTLVSKSEKSLEEIMASRLHALSADADGLLFEALLLPEIIEDAFESRQAQKLPDYLKALAAKLHKFYYDTRVIGHEDEEKLLKLLLVVALSIRTGLSLLGIEAKNSM
jgi:arginyl-tRNA synthetase